MGIFGFLLFSVYRNITEGMGMTKPAFYISLIGLAVNIPANYVFIHGKLGFQARWRGLCIATALVFTAMALTQVIYCHFNKKIDAKALLANFKAPKLATMWTITKVGIPISLATFLK